MKNPTFIKIAGAALVGAIVGVTTVKLWLSDTGEAGEKGKEPLYWVAPMDPNYKRDKPGKSPMGMDLVPVYEEEQGADSPGTVSISPTVENNIAVRTDTVKYGTINQAIKTVGYVQFDEDQLIHIHPRVEGWVEQLHVKASGEPVIKNQPLYELYSPQLVNAQEEYLLALKRNSRELIQAARNRLKSLQIPDTLIEELNKNRQVKQTVTFYAPQNGVIDQLSIREGFFVQPGTTMMSIGTLDQVWVEAEVFESQAGLISKGLPVTMTLDYFNGQSWQGNVDYIYPSLDSTNRTLRVRIRFDNPEHKLKPNMFSQIVIRANSEQRNLLVPKEAVIRTEKQNRVVLALDEGKFKSVEVQLGRVGDEFIEVTEGLKENDKVVISAQFLIDSESSKSSDFKRMSAEDETESAWVEATINSVMAHHNMLNVSHGPVELWKWPAMTMDLDTHDDLDLSKLKQGMTVHIEISKFDDGSFLITQIHIPEQADKQQEEEPVDHSKMDHSSMDHSSMNHGSSREDEQ
ncbi:efflux RND transporter periplasmic adaptor subunit [Kangiella sp.]|uniref:efflux RND transporter periplasmic adaptor subunit n=1 Tax=Kangiella sp. TaxID=1920245 RepID=UPI001982CF49|nr:efflux RND transporter periplasmic adaptor subunit [Kangiella sp.]MBD3653634.1 efflux RND transporter periplasmic adaptor subunit [Kangiella sp.]